VSLIPVGPRKGAGEIGQQYFAVHLSAAFADDLPAPNWKDFVIPWKSAPDGKRVWDVEKIAVKRSGGGDLNGPCINIAKTPDAHDGALANLQEKVIADRDPVWKPSKINEPAANGTGKPKTIRPTLIEALHTLSMYPGSIPSESGVISYFQVQGTWVPVAGEYVIAAPLFKLKWDGVEVKCEPDAAFSSADWASDWTNGWPYKLTPSVIDAVNIEMRAYVKPLLIKEATANYVKYDDDPTYVGGGPAIGPNFKDYWFRAQSIHPWTERLEDFSDGVANISERLRDARGMFENGPGDLSAAWEDLQLMGLAFFGQWVSPQTGGLVKANDSAELLKALQPVLKNPSPAEQQALKDSLDKFRARLRGGTRDERRDTWRLMFRHAFGDDNLTAQDILKRFHESPEEFDLLIFYEWDYVVNNLLDSSGKNLKDNWNGAFKNNRAEQEKYFVDGDQKKFGLKTVREIFENETFSLLVSQPTFAATKAAIIQQLEALRQSFEDAEYVPRLVSSGDLGQSMWDALWRVWTDGGAEPHGYVNRFANLLADPPKTEGKPSGLTIQFDRLEQRKDATTPKDNPTTWRKVGGVGVLVREVAASEQEWHLVSAATMGLRGIRVRSAVPVGADMKTVRLLVEVSPDAPVEPYHLIVGKAEYQGVLAVEGAMPGTSPDVALSPNVVKRGGLLQEVTLKGTKPFAADDLKKIGFMRLLSDPALVPVRVPFRGGVRYPLLTYNQRSLIAPTALADAVKDYFTATEQSKLTPDAIFDYGSAKNGNTLYNLVPLKFGRNYQMAAFVVDTAGGMPDAVSKGLPWVITDGQLTALTLPTGVSAEFPYWRKVPVGQIRVSALSKGDFSQTAWPEVPADVFPLAWETKPNKAITSEAQHKKKSQLVLLHDGDPTAHTFSFGVKLPTIDSDTFERWLPATEADKKHLRDVLTNYFTNLSLRQGPVSDSLAATADEDLTIDDPAVEQLLFVLERYDFEAPEMKWKVIGWHTFPVLQDMTVAGIKRHQRAWVKVLCRRTEQDKEKQEVREPRPAQFPKEAGHDVVIVVQKDPVAVVRLRVFAMVPEKFIENKSDPKFEAGFFEMIDEHDPAKQEKAFVEDFDSPDSGYNFADLDPAQRQAFAQERAGFKCLKPHSILIETPNDKLLTETQLWRKLSLELTGAGRDVVSVSLRKDDEDTRIKLRNVIKCELLRQQWRWQGYPVVHEGVRELMQKWIPPKPRDDAANTDGVVTQDDNEEFLVWELKAFADMDDAFDTLNIPLPYTHEAAELIYEDSFTQDLLARYVRYGLRIYSRYELLFRRSTGTAKPVTSAQPHTIYTQDLKLTGVGWRRALVRYRGLRPLKPIVQAIVPLTLADGDKGRAAPLMLVLDETMFAQCGITEWIECEIVKVALPQADKSGNHNKVDCGGGNVVTRERLHQVGYDPLITTENAACALPNADTETIRPQLVGPFGHTKDTGARQPLFASSSLLVEPYDESVGWYARSWDFAKVRFRRLSGDDLLDDSAGDNEWTEPVWVQFLPSSSFDAPTGAGGDVNLSVAWNLAGKEIMLGTAAAVNPFPEMKKFTMFKYCLLLTYQVKDFRGQGRYEVYHDCVRLTFDADEKSLFGTYDRATDPDSKSVLTARLVEVQSAPIKPKNAPAPYEYEDLPQAGAGEDFAQKFWAALFDTPTEGTAPNAKYRITRISAPVSVAKV
jgi:hypothetical protein